jgi:hypothetical protein
VFELDLRLVSPRGVEALCVVDGLDEAADVAAGASGTGCGSTFPMCGCFRMWGEGGELCALSQQFRNSLFPMVPPNICDIELKFNCLLVLIDLHLVMGFQR